MARKLLFLVLLCSTTAIITCTNGGGGGGGGAGLHMKLTHVDAKGNYTAEELVRRAVAAGKQRLAFLDAAMAAGGGGGVGVPVHWATLQYVAEYLIGDPPQRAEALIDTGSDLIWTQCSTCLRKVCAKQTLPYYNSSASSSFAPVPCTAKICAANDLHFCDLDGGCSVIASYGAGVIVGSLGSEAFAFQSGTAELAFGCVTFTRIIPGALQGASGLIGLGRGRLSLVSQTGAKKFSYCLTRYFHNNGASGHLFVGASASLGGAGGHGDVMTTPFVKGPKGYPFYYLPLVGLTVGKTRLSIPSTVFDLREIAPGFMVGGVIIDSGSPFTSLVHDAYDALAVELMAQLNRSLVPPPAGDDSDALCVARRDVGRVVPALVFHFRGGADMAVPPENYWAPVDKATACMVIASGGPYGRGSVIGNFQQQNMQVLYDLANGEFSFQAADCSAL